jgi:hypothetical protein
MKLLNNGSNMELAKPQKRFLFKLIGLLFIILFVPTNMAFAKFEGDKPPKEIAKAEDQKAIPSEDDEDEDEDDDDC